MKVSDTADRTLPDCTALAAAYLARCLVTKAWRRVARAIAPSSSRFFWTATAVSDADANVDIPTAAVRNYLEQHAIRVALSEPTARDKIFRACEIGCGYGLVHHGAQGVGRHGEGL